jgi:hypothetical protein
MLILVLGVMVLSEELFRMEIIIKEKINEGGWWVLKKYADMNGNNTLKTDRGDDIEVHATKNNNMLQILLGVWTNRNNNDNPIEYSGKTRIHVGEFILSNTSANYTVCQLTLNKEKNGEFQKDVSGMQGPLK